MDKKEKVSKFINESESQYFAEFLKEKLEEPLSPQQKIENSRKKKEFIQKKREEEAEKQGVDPEELDEDEWKPSYEQKWLDNGMYGKIVGDKPYQELDFEQFSFKALAELAEQPELVETINILKDMPRSDRKKSLRIALFDRLKDIESLYFNPALYYDTLELMLEAREVAKTTIESKGYSIVSYSFDSFAFIAGKGDAREVRDAVNSQLDVSKLTLETNQSAINYYNIARFKDEEGEWYEVKQGGTKYDQTKQDVLDHLQEKDFSGAMDAVAEGKQRWEKSGKSYNPDLFKRYMSQIRELQLQVSQ